MIIQNYPHSQAIMSYMFTRLGTELSRVPPADNTAGLHLCTEYGDVSDW